MAKLTLQQIQDMDQATQHYLWQAGVRWGRRQRIDEDMLSEIIQTSIIQLWKSVAEGKEIQSVEAYYYGILNRLNLRYPRTRRTFETVPLHEAHISEEPEAESQVQYLERLWTFMEAVFDLMRQAGGEECVELLLDSYGSAMTDAEIQETSKWSLLFIPQKRRRCLKQFRKIARTLPGYDSWDLQF